MSAPGVGAEVAPPGSGAPSQQAVCPIAGGEAGVDCVYLQVMQAQHLGVVVFDLERHRLSLVNRFASELFARLDVPPTYDALRRLLLDDDPSPPPEEPQARTLQLAGRILGFTVYRARAHAWAYVRDITDKARLEAIAEAVETMNSIGYVFTAVRHELGNPVNSVRAALSVLRANLGKFSGERVAEYLDRITAEMGRVEHLLRSLKSFSLYEQAELRALDVGGFAREFLRLLPGTAPVLQLEVEADIAPGCWASADPRALHQILLNLLSNACDAMQQVPAPALRLAVARDEGLVSICLRDNGAGMTPEQLAQAFQPFFTTKERGTGMGLVISRKLAARMHGTISIDSAPGRGTAVTLTLPECPPCPDGP